tara:strand:- start:867 stop:1877 length:1011 start_codon:yes stop_codon:yes gene_type:complete
MGTFIIAEIGINHNGDIELAKKMVIAAKSCGVNAVKFQTFKATEFISDPTLTYTYKSQGKTITESQLDMFTRYEFSIKEWKELFDFCDDIGIDSFTTPQNITDLDFILEIKKIDFIKVGSDDLTNLPLLKYCASKKIPMIISTGMAFEQEIEDALNIVRNAGCEDISVLHCVSSYPTLPQNVNMRKMTSIAQRFNVKFGFSDHTTDYLSAVTAVALGADIIEKHFTLDKSFPGPDHWFSSNAVEMKLLVDNIRKVEMILGDGKLIPTAEEMEMRKIARRSMVFRKDVKGGKILSDDDFEFKRPGTGLPPSKISDAIGKKLKYDIEKGTQFGYNMIE